MENTYNYYNIDCVEINYEFHLAVTYVILTAVVPNKLMYSTTA